MCEKCGIYINIFLIKHHISTCNKTNICTFCLKTFPEEQLLARHKVACKMMQLKDIGKNITVNEDWTKVFYECPECKVRYSYCLKAKGV